MDKHQSEPFRCSGQQGASLNHMGLSKMKGGGAAIYDILLLEKIHGFRLYSECNRYAMDTDW